MNPTELVKKWREEEAALKAARYLVASSQTVNTSMMPAAPTDKP